VTAAVLAVDGVTMRFGGLAALSSVSLSLASREIVGLIGPNGAGKTTLFNVISGLEPPTAGRIVLDGRDVTGLPPDAICRLGVSRTYQTVRTFLNLSAADNVLVGRYFGSGGEHPLRPDREDAREWLDLVGLADRARVVTRQLSLVERKLVELARALATRPRVLLLDEILSGLAPAETERVLGLMRGLRDRAHATVLWVEHLMRAVAGTCDRVIVLHHGEKLAEGTPTTVMTAPAVIDAYLGRRLRTPPVSIAARTPESPHPSGRAPAATPLLSVDGLATGYGDLQVLWDVSLQVQAGSFTTLIGANGGGKTTTLRSISGLVPPWRGAVRFDDQDLVGIGPHRIAGLGIAHVPEGRRVFPLMSVQENLELGAYAPPARAVRHDTMEQVFALFPRLRERRGQTAGSLSGGEQQMLAIGRALMACPKLLMLDEPSIGLMPRLVESLFDTLLEINRGGLAILLVEQNVREAMAVASDVYVLENGRIVRSGPSADFVEDEGLREAYLGVRGDLP
jgi:branched-chain amino acid transport system ATP-binding protein